MTENFSRSTEDGTIMSSWSNIIIHGKIQILIRS